MSRAVEQHVGRVERAQLRRVLGPAERRERPQPGGEPGVEDVGVLLPALALGRLDPAVDLLAAVPDGDPVAPPQLARDAPGADVLHPLEVAPPLALGADADAAVADDLERGLGELVHAAEPLQRDQRLDPLAGAVGERDVVRVGLGARDPALLAQRLDHRLARLERGEALEALAGRRGHAAVLADRGDLLEPVGAADLEVVGVVPGRDLQRAGAELGLHVRVGDDLQPPPDDRQDRRLPHQARVAVVVGMDGDRGVGEHRLGPHGGDRDRAVAALERVVDPVQRVGDLALLDLEVGDRRARARVPVDHVVVAVDQALLVERDEDLQDRVDVARRRA